MIPIAAEVFWSPMAFAMIGGIVIATVLTLLFMPALYVAWYRVEEPQPTAGVQGGSGSPSVRGLRLSYEIGGGEQWSLCVSGEYSVREGGSILQRCFVTRKPSAVRDPFGSAATCWCSIKRIVVEHALIAARAVR